MGVLGVLWRDGGSVEGRAADRIDRIKWCLWHRNRLCPREALYPKERRRQNKRIATSFVESTVNTLVGKRFAKNQQMQWSKKGAHHMLQIRARTLDGSLQTMFKKWFPGVPANDPKDSELSTVA